MKSIKAKIIAGIIICTLLSSASIGFLSIKDIYQTSDQGAEKEMTLTCLNGQSEINAQIAQIAQSVDTLSSIAMERLDFSKFKGNNTYVTQYTESLMSDVVKFGENTDGAICVYVRYNPDFTAPTSGIFLTRNSTEEPFTSSTPTDFTMYEKTDLERVALIDKNGDAYYDNGATKNVSHRRYFKEAISGKQTLSDPLESSVDYEVRVVLGVPVYKNDKVIGVLGGSCNVTALSHMLFDDLFDGAGNSFLVTSDGEIIAFDSGSASSTEITYGTNLFEYYGEKNLRGKHTLQDMQVDFKKGDNGLVKLSLGERKEEVCYLAYMPIGYNDWMICYTVPVKNAQQVYDFISRYELIFMGAFCILVAMLVLYIIVRNNKEKAVLIRSAQTDALTGVYNKENTQNMIDEILRKKDPDSFHGFLILDMDHFKEVNDVYGHAMGDKVLEMLGNFLKKQFREQDVIGRIGGDEFVILLYNIGSRQNMENRVKSLQEKIREIHMDGMEGHTFTLSAGIAFAPQDGDTFMELYQKADLALYQVKRSGRNGYRIYK